MYIPRLLAKQDDRRTYILQREHENPCPSAKQGDKGDMWTYKH